MASIDQTLAAIDHYCEKQDLDGLEKLVKRGEMEWLAREEAERFPVHTFTPESLREMFEKGGFEVLDIVGKTVLPMKKLEAMFEDERDAQRIRLVGGNRLISVQGDGVNLPILYFLAKKTGRPVKWIEDRREHLIAANHSVEEICGFLGADSLGYLSLSGLLDSVGDPGQTKFCAACYTGNYPTQLAGLVETSR